MVPKLGNPEGDGLQFNVDVALNGQQFTGRPLQFRYYDIVIDKIEPSIGPSEGGTVINVSVILLLIFCFTRLSGKAYMTQQLRE